MEYKDFSPMLARRALKLYVEQFDPEKIYLLSDEARPFLDPKSGQLKLVVENYQKDDFSQFDMLNRVVQKAILRERKLREQCIAELVMDLEQRVSGQMDSFADFAKSESELKERTKKYLVHLLEKERAYARGSNWGSKQAQKTFDLWQRRFHRLEESYLFVDAHGKSLALDKAEHFF